MAPSFLNTLGSAWALAAGGLLALIGLTLVAAGLLGARSRGRRRCPGCWYDMAGSAPAFPVTCPECGRSIPDERALFRRRRRWGRAAIGLTLLVPFLSQLAYRFGYDLYYTLMPRWKTVESLSIGDTTATRRALRDHRERGQHATITHRGRVILDIRDFDITFGQRDWSLPPGSIAHKLGAGDDLNLDRVPELVVFAYSGGAHCCYTVTILELTDPPRTVATIDARDGLHIRPVAAGSARPGEHVLVLADQSFDYWHAPHASSPMPRVCYRLTDGHLAVDLGEMLKPPPEPDRLAADAARLRAALAPAGSPLDPDLWRIMLDLIYSGSESLAAPFFDDAWPPERPGKDAFDAEFRAVLKSSPHHRNFLAALEARRRDPFATLPAAVLPQPAPPDQP